jgi:hypothetical protein
MEKVKVCSKCKESKPFSSFSKGFDRYGLQYLCKQCKAFASKMFYESKKEGSNKDLARKKMKLISNIPLQNQLWLEQWKMENKERIEKTFIKILETIK